MRLYWVSSFSRVLGEFSKDFKEYEFSPQFADTLDINFKEIAAKLFKEFCYFFSLTDQDIGYIVESEGKQIIDMEKFKNK